MEEFFENIRELGSISNEELDKILEKHYHFVENNEEPDEELMEEVLEATGRFILGDNQIFVPVVLVGIMPEARDYEGDKIETPGFFLPIATLHSEEKEDDENKVAIPIFTDSEKMKVDEDMSVNGFSLGVAEFIFYARNIENIEGFLINPWGKSFFLDIDFADFIMDKIEESDDEEDPTENKKDVEKEKGHKHSAPVYLKKGDITEADVEAIVNAANTSLLGGGGVDGAIHKAAGPKLLEECRKLKGCKTGEAKITKGYNLNADYVIHTVGPIYSGKAADEVFLTSCYKNSLNLAKDNSIHSIAFPAISTGIYGYPIEAAAKAAVSAILDWKEENPFYPMEIYLYAFDDINYNALLNCL